MPVADLTYVTAETESMYGTIRSAWTKEADGSFVLEVTIPANATGTVYVPAQAEADVKVGATGARFLRMEDGYALYAVEAGTYRFTSESNE